MQSIALKRVPAHKLPTPDNQTIGWVKPVLFVREYNAHDLTSLDVLPSMISDDDSATNPINEQPVKHRTLFLSLHMHPGLPTYPGQPGSFISNGENIPLGEPVLVIVESAGTSQFVGRYVPRQAKRAITKEEWQDMPKVRSLPCTSTSKESKI